MNSYSRHVSLNYLVPADPLLVAIAEADLTLLNQMADELREDGFEVVELHDGIELEDYLRDAQDGFRARPDVIISESEMPGQGGLAVLEHLRDFRSMTPFILINSNGALSTFEKAEQLGADFVLQPPLTSNELCELVHIAV
jgi:DNA-binding response OmpR family regulator